MARSVLRQAVVAKFNSLSRLNYFDEQLYQFPLPNPTSAQENILKLFGFLSTSSSSGEDGLTEGLRAQFITTNYDYVIETILDNINPDADGSIFIYTYRGITPKVAKSPNPRPLHGHWLVDHLLKLNGGFEILADEFRVHARLLGPICERSC